MKQLRPHVRNGGFPFIIYTENNVRQEGIDAGGLRRDLQRLMLKHLFPKKPEKRDGAIPFWCVSSLLRPDQNGVLPIARSNEEVECYRTIGNLLAIAYKGTELTGKHFAPCLFRALPLLFVPESSSSQLSLIKLFATVFDRQELLKLINHEELSEQDNVRLQLFLNSECEIKMNQDSDMKMSKEKIFSIENLAKVINTSLLDEIPSPEFGIYRFQNVLDGIKAIGEGMHEVLQKEWEEALGDPKAMAERIEGKLTRGLIIDSLEFSPQISQLTKDFLVSWINQAKPVDLKKFIYIVTGSPSLLSSTKITVKHVQGQVHLPAANTCSNQISIINYNNEKLFHEQMNTFLKLAAKGFSAA